MRRIAGLLACVVVLALFGAHRAPVCRADEEASGPETWLILGPDGRPLDRAMVTTVDVPEGGRPAFEADPGSAESTLRRGRLVRAPAGPTSRLVVWGVGLTAQVLERSSTVVGVRLSRAMPIGGRLRFDRGAPAADVVVLASRPGLEGLVHRTRTDEQGVWQLAHTGAGSWDVTVLRGDGRTQSLGVFQAGAAVGERLLTPGSRVEGRILDGDAAESTGVGDLRFVLVRLPGGERPPGPPVESGEDGRFVLDDVPAGIYEARLVETRWFFDPASPRVEVPARGVVRLDGWFALRSRTVIGRVEGPRSKTVGAARVQLLPDATRTPPEGGWPYVEPVETDAAGRFELRGVRPAEDYRLVVSASGYAGVVTAPFDVVGPKPTTVPTVSLPRGWRLEARVRAPGGAPVPDVQVETVPADRPVVRGGPGWAAMARSGRTDASGRVTLEDLPKGDVRVRAVSARFVTVEGIVAYPPSGDVRTWTATVFPAPTLAGKVVPWGGHRLPPLDVRLVSQGDGSERSATVEDGGTFRFEGLAAEPVDLEVVRPGGPRDLVLARVVGVMPGADYIEVALPELTAIRGTVEDLEPAGGEALVLLEAPVPDHLDDVFRWKTVADFVLPEGSIRGRFSFAGLAPGTYGIRAIQGGNDTGVTTVRLLAGATEAVDLVMPVSGRVAGTVLDARDLPLLGADVRIVRLRGDGDAPGRPAGPVRKATARDGSYVFEDVAPGVWRVEVRDGDHASDQEEVRVAEGENIVVRDLLVGRGGVLSGSFSDGEGRSLDGALILLDAVADGPASRRARTGLDGAFRIAGLRPGVWRVRLAARAGPFTDLEVLAEIVRDETTRLDLTAAGRGRILGRVWRQGRPVADALLHLVSRPGGDAGLARRRAARTDAEGRFTWDGLPPGSYEVDLTEGATWSTQPVRLEDGDTLTLDLESWTARIPGQVVTVTGADVSDATVIAKPSDGRAFGPLGRARTDPAGRFVIVGLMPGAYDLEVSAPGLPPGRWLGALAEEFGAERPVSVTLGRGGTLDLTVLDADSRGVAGTQIWLEDEGGTALHRRPYTTSGGGRLRLVGVSPGRLWIRPYARRHGRPERSTVRVREGEETRLEMVLPPPARLRLQVTGRLDPVTRTRVDLLRMPGRRPVEQRRTLGRIRLDPVWGRLPRTGVVTFEDLGPGWYVIRIDAGPAFEIAEIPYEIGANDDAEVRVDLVPR